MKVFVYSLLLLFCLHPDILQAQEKEKKTVLVLYSFGQSYPATVQWNKGIREVFNSQQDFEITINTEHLDLSKYYDAGYIKEVLDLLNYKYADKPPDLIITVFEPAFEFILNHRNSLFPDVPIVLGGIERSSTTDLDFDKNTRVVFQGQNEFKKTVELALSLHPKTQNVIIIAGSGHLEQSWYNSAKPTFQLYHDKLNFSHLIGLPLNELINEVEKLPGKSIVFYFPVLEDKDGRNYVAVNALSSISEVSSTPIYSFWEIFMGHGIVGGYLKSFPMQAQITAKVGLNVLSGESPEMVNPVQNEATERIFDYRQLKRWSISDSELPEGSEIRFIEYTYWEDHWKQIVLIIAAFVILLIIIGYLIAQKRILRLSQVELIQTKRKYKTVADYTSDWEYWQHPDGSMAWISPSCEQVCGYSSELISGNPDLIPHMIRQGDKRIWENHNCKDNKRVIRKGIRFRILTKQGEVRWIEHTCQKVIDEEGKNQGVRANNRDITDREKYKTQTNKLQSELIHVERLATISALTYALAHEINQPLTSIRSYAQAALRFMHNDQDERENVEKALQGIVSDNKRAAAVVNQLRDLVKKKDVETRAVDINSIVESVLSLLNSEFIIRNTTLKLNLDREIPNIDGDSIQLQQVFLNLLTNALDAMEGVIAKKKILAISTKTNNSEGILISIADSGVGIPEDKLEKIFETFHTSKSDGIGLGLAISKSIVESHGGKIWAENNASAGARIVVLLPGTI